MIFSIVLGLVVLIIALDSIGSKRVRALIIKEAKFAFERSCAEDKDISMQTLEDLPKEVQQLLKASHANEKAPTLTLRMKLKGAKKLAKRKNWTPIEQKLFLSHYPPSLIAYQDATLGFLISQKRFAVLSANEEKVGQRILSIFSQNQKNKEQMVLEGLVQYLAMLPWQPNFARSSTIKWEGKGATLTLGKKAIKGQFKFGKKGLIQQLSGSFVLDDGPSSKKINFQFNYSDYRTYDDLMLPFHLKILFWECKNQNDLFEFDVTDLVYDEAFAWW